MLLLLPIPAKPPAPLDPSVPSHHSALAAPPCAQAVHNPIQLASAGYPARAAHSCPVRVDSSRPLPLHVAPSVPHRRRSRCPCPLPTHRLCLLAPLLQHLRHKTIAVGLLAIKKKKLQKET
ncbi:hypothetical protein M0R45_001936 [Rubus argutus]|uniref:Uncharacterized protein n=1 Tax=Rubus argutus TaxID=59490 RepID=A0AAW1VKR2_RUBAR